MGMLRLACFAVGGDSLLPGGIQGIAESMLAGVLVLAAPVVGLTAWWVAGSCTRRPGRAAGVGGGFAVATLALAAAFWLEVGPLPGFAEWALHTVETEDGSAAGLYALFIAVVCVAAVWLVPCVARTRVPWPRARRIGVWAAGCVLAVQPFLVLAVFGPVWMSLTLFAALTTGLLVYRVWLRRAATEPAAAPDRGGQSD
jgi:hypothetical protein